MLGMITVGVEVLGSRWPSLADWSIPYPPAPKTGGDRITLRTLIGRIVSEEVEAFRRRQRDARFIRVLTERQIEEGARRGKVDPGGRDREQKVDEEHAIAAALQAFVDGLYLVFIDDEQHHELDHEVFLNPESRVRFVRLTMLAGG